MADVVVQPEAGQSETPEHLEAATTWLQQRGLQALIGVALCLVVLFGLIFYQKRNEETRRDAMLMLATARSFDDLERIVSDHGSTPAAPLALLKLGQVHYASGNYVAAMEKYDAFSAKFAQHDLAPAAELGKLHAMEALGRTQEALDGFQAFATRLSDHFLAPQAIFGAGRCLEQFGRWAEARALYEQFIAAHPTSPWTRRADELLELVNHRIARGDTAPPPAVEASPIAGGAFAPYTLPGE